MKQSEVAEAADVWRQYVAMYEREKAIPQKALDELCMLVDISDVGFRKDGRLILPE